MGLEVGLTESNLFVNRPMQNTGYRAYAKAGSIPVIRLRMDIYTLSCRTLTLSTRQCPESLGRQSGGNESPHYHRKLSAKAKT